jgi:hypothetical protein
MSPKEYRDAIRALNVEEARANASAAQWHEAHAKTLMRPSMLMHVVLKRDGGHWVCFHPSTEDETDSVIAYGSSPHQAMLNFDNLFVGPDVELDPDDPDNKDSELEEF